MRVTVVIAAGGLGTRVGGDVPKQLRTIGGQTLLEHALQPFDQNPRVNDIVIVLPEGVAGALPAALRTVDTPVRFVTGGARRQDSVAAGVDQVGTDTDVVLIHDAARPFCTTEIVDAVIDAAAEAGAAVPAIRASDTVKEVRSDDADAGAARRRIVRATLPRDHIYLAQTPQGFALEVIRAAVELGRRGVVATDEAVLVERSGHAVRLVDGDAANFKVTTSEDLARARDRIQRAAGGEMPTVRVGVGYDSHRTAAGRRLILGGVEIPHAVGLDGHSDADAVCHAVTDAILGAAAAGDIGRHFPDTDPRWKDASSIELLRTAVDIVAERGLEVGNVDVVVIAEHARIRPHVSAMVEQLSSALGVDAGAISIKGKTAEGMDAIGRGEAIAAHAVATLVPR